MRNEGLLAVELFETAQRELSEKLNELSSQTKGIDIRDGLEKIKA